MKNYCSLTPKDFENLRENLKQFQESTMYGRESDSADPDLAEALGAIPETDDNIEPKSLIEGVQGVDLTAFGQRGRCAGIRGHRIIIACGRLLPGGPSTCDGGTELPSEDRG